MNSHEIAILIIRYLALTMVLKAVGILPQFMMMASPLTPGGMAVVLVSMIGLYSGLGVAFWIGAPRIAAAMISGFGGSGAAIKLDPAAMTTLKYILFACVGLMILAAAVEPAGKMVSAAMAWGTRAAVARTMVDYGVQAILLVALGAGLVLCGQRGIAGQSGETK